MGSKQTKEYLSDVLLHHKDTIKGLEFNKIGLLGSFIKGGQSADSDVDLLVEFLPVKKNFRNFMRPAFFLDDSSIAKLRLSP